MARFFKLLIVTGCVLFAVAAFLYVIPSDQYLLLPDRAQPLASKVLVKGERADDDGGGIYYVAVEIDKASLLEKLFHGFREGSTLVPASALRAPGESESSTARSSAPWWSPRRSAPRSHSGHWAIACP